MKNEHTQLRGMTRGPLRANELGCRPTMRFMKNEKMAIMTTSSCMSSVFILTKHARKIAMHLAPEKTLLHALPIRQFYDAGNSLIALCGPALCGPSL